MNYVATSEQQIKYPFICMNVHKFLQCHAVYCILLINQYLLARHILLSVYVINVRNCLMFAAF